MVSDGFAPIEARLTIGGRSEAGSAIADVIDPSSGEPFAKTPLADQSQVESAIEAAHAAFGAWAGLPWGARRDLIKAFAGALRARAEAIGSVLTREQGKPIARAVGEVQGAAGFAEALAQLTLPNETLRNDAQGQAELVHRPLGVAVCITAWNFPLMLAVWKIVPALLTGNTVVLKPSPYTPLSTLMLGEIAREIFPSGVINVVACTDSTAAVLTTHPLVRKISFTGSTRTGQAIAAAAARCGLKRLTLELGGNDAAIVLDDVDPARVAPQLFWAKFHNSGQLCAAAKRLYVHRSQHDALCDALLEIGKTVVVGPGLDPGTQLGPLQNEHQVRHMRELVADAIDRGAQLLWQGTAPEGKGYFFPVTLLIDVPSDARVVREEAFGPVLPIMRFDEDQEALRRANDSEFGLGGSVWSADVERARKLAAGLDVGTSWVNQHPAVAPDVPFGGAKLSGVGVEFSRRGLEEFTQLHAISVLQSAGSTRA